MVETSVIVHTVMWTFMIAAISTDFFNGKWDVYGPYPRRPLQDKSQDRWPAKEKKNETD